MFPDHNLPTDDVTGYKLQLGSDLGVLDNTITQLTTKTKSLEL